MEVCTLSLQRDRLPRNVSVWPAEGAGGPQCGESAGPASKHARKLLPVKLFSPHQRRAHSVDGVGVQINVTSGSRTKEQAQNPSQSQPAGVHGSVSTEVLCTVSVSHCV